MNDQSPLRLLPPCGQDRWSPDHEPPRRAARQVGHLWALTVWVNQLTPLGLERLLERAREPSHMELKGRRDAWSYHGVLATGQVQHVRDTWLSAAMDDTRTGRRFTAVFVSSDLGRDRTELLATLAPHGPGALPARLWIGRHDGTLDRVFWPTAKQLARNLPPSYLRRPHPDRCRP